MINLSDDLLVSVSGVRGTIPKGLNPNTIIAFTCAFGEEIAPDLKSGKKPKLILARDNRPSGEMMASIVKGCLTAMGFRVLDIGIAPTPSVKATVLYKKANGGIMLSASHNPMNWNAFKFIDSDGFFLDAGRMDKILKRAQHGRPVWQSVENFGITKTSLAYRKHIAEILEKNPYVKKIKKRKFRVAIDTVNGAANDALPLLLRKLGCKVFKVNCDTDPIFPRPPEPTPDALKDLGKLVKKNKCDIGFATDPDADRLAIVSEKGKAIGEEYTLALAMISALANRKGDVVINLSSSMLNEAVAESFGKKVIRTSVGEANVVAKMRQVKAAFGGEGNGGVIDPQIASYGRDSLSGVVHVLATLAATKKNAGDLAKSLPYYKIVKSKTQRKHWDDNVQTEIKRKIQNEMGNCKLNEEDGLHFQGGSDWWIHIRKSNTEPILRFIYEGKKDIMPKLKALVKDCMELVK